MKGTKLKTRKSNTDRGITLVALIITIVVLLILAVVSINTITNDGILNHAQNATKKYNQAVTDEQTMLNKYEEYLSGLQNGGNGDTNPPATIEKVADVKTNGKVFTTNTELKDDYDNKVMIPAGFKIASDSGTNVVDGIVIEDVNANGANSSTTGSQFVWVPVGNVKTSTSSITIALKRYVFSSTGEIDETLTKIEPGDQLTTLLSSITYYTEGKKNETTSNTHAIDIAAFRTSVGTNAGYYIGRYEASISGDTIKTISGVTVYENESQPDSATKARNMYTEKTFTSDLVNSYAWDTAIVYIQKLSTNSDASNYSNLNKSTSFKTTGGNSDEYCKINDMSGNAKEWSTESSSDGEQPCVVRGGYLNYDSTDGAAKTREYSGSTGRADIPHSFRPILYF